MLVVSPLDWTFKQRLDAEDHIRQSRIGDRKLCDFIAQDFRFCELRFEKVA